MAYKKRNYRRKRPSRRPRTYRKARYGRRRRTSPLMMVPAEKRFKLRMNTTFQLYSSATDQASKVFDFGNLYDIDPDVGGPSFGGYTSWAAFYKRYRVQAVKFTLKVWNYETQPMAVTYRWMPGEAASEPTTSTFQETVEQGAPFVICPPAGNGVVKTLKQYMTMRRLWGTKEVSTDLAWAADFGYGPSAVSNIRFEASTVSGVMTSAGVRCLLTATFYGAFTNKKSNIA